MLNKCRERGFSLIEVMVTVVIVSIGMLSMASLLVASIKANAGSEKRLDAAALAQSLSSRISVKAAAAGYTQGTASFDAQNMLADRYNGAGLSGGYQSSVALSPSPTVAGYTSITVTLKWKENDVWKQVQLESGTVTN